MYMYLAIFFHIFMYVNIASWLGIVTTVYYFYNNSEIGKVLRKLSLNRSLALRYTCRTVAVVWSGFCTCMFTDFPHVEVQQQRGIAQRRDQTFPGISWLAWCGVVVWGFPWPTTSSMYSYTDIKNLCVKLHLPNNFWSGPNVIGKFVHRFFIEHISRVIIIDVTNTY